MARHTPFPRRSPERRRDLVDAQRRSGLSIAAFARQEGLVHPDLRRPVPQVPAADVLSEDDRHPARPCRTLKAAATRTIRSRAGSARGPVARSGLESPSDLETALNDRVQRGGGPGRPASGASGDATAFTLGAPRRRPSHPDRRATPRIPGQHLSEVARHAVETRRRSKSVLSVHGRHDKAELACPNFPPGLLLLSV